MTGDYGLGMLCCAVAAVGFGSNYLPVKQVDCGDGFFFAAMMAVGIGIVGLGVNYSMLTTGDMFVSPHFEPMAMLGGAAWMVGNLMTPTIIRWVGLGIGLSIWDLSNMLMGWATGNFGLFGVWRENVKSPWMNYLGLSLAGVSLILFAQAMEKDDDTAVEKPKSEEAGDVADFASEAELEEGCAAGVVEHPTRSCTTMSDAGTAASEATLEEGCAAVVVQKSSRRGTVMSSVSTEALSTTWSDTSENTEDLSDVVAGQGECSNAVSKDDAQLTGDTASEGEWPKKMSSHRTLQLVGFGMALVAGCLFGYTFDPPTTLMQDGRVQGSHSTNPMDYVLSHFCGIVAMGVASLLIYVMVRRERSYTPRNIVMPSIMSGMMWGVAQAAWFRANVELSIVVAFPIVSSLPGIVALAWGVLCFGELRSSRSRCFAAAGLCVRIPSVLLIALSNL